MKTNFILAISVLLIVGTSCKKTRSCRCNITNTITYTDQWNTTTYTYIDARAKTESKQSKKKFIEDTQCYNTTTKTTDSGQGWRSQTVVETSCSLK